MYNHRFTEGQRVRIDTRSSTHDGKMGTVVNPFTLIGTVSVQVDGQPEGNHNGFLGSELIPVDSPE